MSTKKVKSGPSVESVSITRVCNCKVKYLRPQYRDLEQWCQDSANNTYIGRAGVVFVKGSRYPKQSSIWANPFKIGKDGNRGQVIAKYRSYIKEKISRDPESYNLEELRGKTLGCWCISNEQGCTTSYDADSTILECHGQVLLELLS